MSKGEGKGKEEEGNGEREIGSEALAETGKSRKRPIRESNLTLANAADALPSYFLATFVS